MRLLLGLLVCFFASTAGAICGIGGGVVIKPVLDVLGLFSVETGSFLSGCTVLAMSTYTLLRNLRHPTGDIEWGRTAFLSVGAGLGGVAGKELFSAILRWTQAEQTVGAVQSEALFLTTAAILFYTLRKDRIRTMEVHRRSACVAVGFVLGAISSFLGIGGGPLNLVVLSFFFSMPTKTSVQNSLCIIFFSQASNLIYTILGGAVPPFSLPVLLGMMLLGILGGALGHRINQAIPARRVDRFFLWMLVVILCICVWNIFKFLG